MYLDHFGLTEAPFSITPDPTFVYLSGRHRDALAHLLYGVGQGGSGGFVQLTGEVGTGKTTLCRCLLEQVPKGTHIALVLNPLMTPLEMLQAICEELGVSTRGARTSSKQLVDRLNRFLLEVHSRGERVVVVIDEAQNLSPEALEQIRLLTNLETSKEKLLQVILLGQPELRDLLRRPSLRQLSQRITARYHLTPLGPQETARYVRHRMEVAGAGRRVFRGDAVRALYRRSLGVPRLINIIADRALAGAFARDRRDVDARLVNAAANEVQLGEPGIRRRRWPRMLTAAVAVAGLLLVGWSALQVRGLTPDTLFGLAPPSAAPAEAAPPESEGSAGPAPREPGLPDAAWLERQHGDAWRGLARAWGRPDDAAALEASCNGGTASGYACLRETGNWSRIRRLGLPVVLVLDGAGGRHLLLSGIRDERLLVGPPTESTVVSREDIEPLWLGAYLVVWPQAPNWPRVVGRGDRGPAVEAILSMAAQADQPYRGEPAFGPGFERWLMDFQARNGLVPDGIVGPATLLYLMRFSIEQPRLLTHWESEA